MICSQYDESESRLAEALKVDVSNRRKPLVDIFEPRIDNALVDCYQSIASQSYRDIHRNSATSPVSPIAHYLGGQFDTCYGLPALIEARYCTQVTPRLQIVSFMPLNLSAL